MPRLQFSLRALLLLMALVGVAIVVYRMPWTETTFEGAYMTTTVYHRGWSGRPVKHGVEVTTMDGPMGGPFKKSEAWFCEGDLRRERHWINERLMLDQHHRDGKSDGPCFMADYMGGGTGTWQGQFRQGKKVGVWQSRGYDVWVDDEWQDDQLHGRKTWHTPQGRVLQTADYEAGRLVGWNGQPVAAEFRCWLITTIPDPELRRNLLEPCHPEDQPQQPVTVERLFCVGQPKRQFAVQWPQPYLVEDAIFRGQPIGEAILELALEHSSTLAYRFNRLHIVRLTPEELDWQDRTGVNDIRFEPGSKQEQFWLDEGVVDPYFAKHTGSRLKGMLYAGSGIQIECDTTAVKETRYSPDYGGRLPRTRSDLMGQDLDREGFYCEQRGNTLVIKPHRDVKRGTD